MDTVRNAPVEDESLIYLAAGGITAILLGMALVPLRDFTVASNFTFPFMALTIAVAEFGGRRAAVVTALISALSLDFFLTQPYLRLTIAGKHDLIAFLGLAACGLVAAAFGSGRRRKTMALQTASTNLDLLRALLRQAGGAGSLREMLSRVLEDVRAALPIAALAVRDLQGGILAACGGGESKPVPRRELDPDTLQSIEIAPLFSPTAGGPAPAEVASRAPSGDDRRLQGDVTTSSLPRAGVALPAEGARLVLELGRRRMGWLDLWGTGAPVGPEARQTLSDIVRLLSVRLAAAESMTRES